MLTVFTNQDWGHIKFGSMHIPGPSSTESGLPVLSTGSPIVTPADTSVKDFKKMKWIASVHKNYSICG